MKDDVTLEQRMMEVYESASADHPELADRIMARCSPEQRLRGLTLEERLGGLTLEEWVRRLSPDELEQIRRLVQ